MPMIRISASTTIPAPAPVLYDLIADYHSGHPRILPREYFTALTVLEGGRGAGTRIRFSMRAFGRITTDTAVITEPVPGRELRETLASGITTTFLVEPLAAAATRVTITTGYAKGGLLGWLESLLAPRYLRRVYAAELAQLARVAAEVSPAGHAPAESRAMKDRVAHGEPIDD